MVSPQRSTKPAPTRSRSSSGSRTGTSRAKRAQITNPNAMNRGTFRSSDGTCARPADRWMRAVFGGKVVPAKQQQEWTELVSTKTGEPIATVSADNPEGFALGLAERILGPLGAQWFYEGESLVYRTIYVWI